MNTKLSIIRWLFCYGFLYNKTTCKNGSYIASLLFLGIPVSDIGAVFTFVY